LATDQPRRDQAPRDQPRSQPRRKTRSPKRSAAREAAREAKGDLYRKLVLDAARQVFARKGYDDAKMGEVADASGLSLQTLYSAFPGKAAIYQAVQENGDRALHARALEATRGVADPLAALLAGLSATTAYFIEHPDFLRIRLHGGFTWGTEESAAGDRGLTGAWRAALEMLRAACQRCIAAGIFVDRDPALIARMTVAMQQVELAHWLEGGMRADAAQVTADLEEQVTRSFMRPTAEAARAAGGA